MSESILEKAGFNPDDLNGKANLLYIHSSLYGRESMLQKDYGGGCVMSEVEAHTLGYLCLHQDCTVTELARLFYRTKGAISKTLRKLEEKGLVRREWKNGNHKWVYFQPTEKGFHYDEIHRAYDRAGVQELISTISDRCTTEDIKSFYKVIACRVRFYETTHAPTE